MSGRYTCVALDRHTGKFHTWGSKADTHDGAWSELLEFCNPNGLTYGQQIEQDVRYLAYGVSTTADTL